MNELTNLDFALLFRLIIAHLLADFLFQRKSWIHERLSKHWKSKTLYLHVLVVGVLTYLFSGYYSNFYIPILVILTHYLTDLLKSYTGNSLKYFLLDQAVHLIIVAVAWYLYLMPDINLLEQFHFIFTDLKILSIGTAYFFITFPSVFLIAKITEGWQQEISNEGLKDAGKWIGILERILILTFVLINQFAGIGFLIAAKSILRYGDIKNAENRKDAEYILLGTMVSFIIAILTGLAAKWVTLI